MVLYPREPNVHGADKKAGCQTCSHDRWLGHIWRIIEDHSATQDDRLAKIVSEEFTRWLPPT